MSRVARWTSRNSRSLAAAVCSLALLSACGGSAAQPSADSTSNPSAASATAGPALDGVPRCPRTSTTVAPLGEGLPDLVLPCLTAGPAVRLAGLRGTPTVINVWASWCPPCRDELPYFVGLRDRFAGDVDVLGIDLLDRDEAARAVLEDFGLDYPSVVDADGKTRAELAIQAPPVTLFVDAEGRIVDRKVGAMRSQAELDGLVASALGVDPR